MRAGQCEVLRPLGGLVEAGLDPLLLAGGGSPLPEEAAGREVAAKLRDPARIERRRWFKPTTAGVMRRQPWFAVPWTFIA